MHISLYCEPPGAWPLDIILAASRDPYQAGGERCIGMGGYGGRADGLEEREEGVPPTTAQHHSSSLVPALRI